MKHILYIRTDRIGDFILNLPAIHALKKEDTKITVVLNPRVKPLVEGHLDIDEFSEFQTVTKRTLQEAWRFFKILRKKKFDVAIVSNPHKLLHCIVFALRIPIRIGYTRKWGCLLTHTIEDRKAESTKHEIEYNLDLVSQVLPSSRPEISFHLPLSIEDEVSLKNFMSYMKIPLSPPPVVLNPETTHPQKEWPIEKMVQLSHVLSSKLPHSILISGEKPDKHFLGQNNIYDLRGKLTLKLLSTLLKHSELLISNDSGPVHIATAFQTKTIVLYGKNVTGSNPTRWGPISWESLDKRPKYKTIVKPHITDMSVEDVWKEVKNLLHS